MTKWLKNHRFSYKQPQAFPTKADRVKQEAFPVLPGFSS
jgi:hypothetical protein